MTKEPRYRLRSTPKDVAKEDAEIEFGLNDDWRQEVYIENDFEDNGDGTVTDHATDLMWYLTGSSGWMTWDQALQWLDDEKNIDCRGHHDWRLPTVGEAASLLEPNKKNGKSYIDPVFSNLQEWIWSCDKYGLEPGWLVSFNSGTVGWSGISVGHYVRPVRSLTPPPKLYQITFV